MKYFILFLMLFISAFQTNAQTNDIEQIKYSNDSIPILIKFKPGAVKHNHSEAKLVIKKHLKLTDDNDLRTKKSFIDDLGFKHERFQHYFKGLKVEFSEYTVHSKSDKIQSISGNLKIIKSINTKPSLIENEALGFALKYVNAEIYMWQIDDMENRLKKDKGDNSATYYPKGELVIWTDWKSRKALLAYKFDIYVHTPFKHVYIYIDAHAGNIIDVQQILKNDAVTGTAATRYSGNINLTTDSFTGGYRLRDPSRGNGIETMDMNKGTIISSAIDFVDNDNNWSAAEWNNTQKDNAALDAHYAAQLTYDYFGQQFIGRNGWDNSNTILRLYVHFSNNWNNAGWDTSSDHIVLGDGDGVIFNPLTDLDVIAHEIGHGISDDEIGLNTNDEPGAIDEGLSDIWAACVEQFAAIPGNNIWIMGEDYQIEVNHRRNMQNPNASHYHENGILTNPPIPYPDTYMGDDWYTGSWDYNGRHINCTVLSHWFYLLSQGGTGINDLDNCFNVTGIGIIDAASIVYRMETVYLTSNSSFNDSRTYAIQSAAELFGTNSNQVAQTMNAWYAVGIGDKYIMSISGPNTVCSSSSSFNIKNLPAGDSITWNKSTNITRSSSQGSNPCSFAANGSGEGWIEATINSTSCGSITLPRKEVWVGIPTNDQIDFGVFFSNPPHDQVPIMEPVAIGIFDNPDATDQSVTSYNWQFGGWSSYITSYGGHGGVSNDVAYLELDNYAPSTQIVLVSAVNACGMDFMMAKGKMFYAIDNYYYMSVSPNPATDFVEVNFYESDELNAPEKRAKVAVKPDKAQKDKELSYELQLWNEQGMLLKQKSNKKKLQLQTGNLKSGNYFLHVLVNDETYKQQIIITH